MDLELLQKKYDRLLHLTRKVRGHQKEYYKYRASDDREKARYWERHLDQFIKDEVKVMGSNQKEIF